MKVSVKFILLAIGTCLQSCASFTGFQDAKTVGENNWELSTSINRGTTPNFEEGNSIEDFANYYSLEIGSRYGISEKVDLSLKINSNLNVALGTKYQIKGDQSSKNALAVGLEVGSFTVLTPLLNIQLPLYYSHHFNDKWTWNLSPRYVVQFKLDNVQDNSGIQYIGGNTGFIYGSKHKLAIDLGIYSASISEMRITNKSLIYNFGIGGKFLFLDKDEDPKSKRPKRKREIE